MYRRSFAWVALLCLFPSFANGQRPTWKEYCVQEADKYAIAADIKQQSPDEAWQRIPDAIFTHINPISRDERGLVYLWKQQNSKPVAVVTVIVSRRNNIPLWYDVHELHSLHDQPLSATYEGEPTWTPEKGGLRWSVVPDAPVPANQPRLIQRQAKLLTKNFSSEATMKGQVWPLRRIEKPVYQYDFQEEDERTCGGAIFCFCRATDPESMLVLEVRKDDSGKYQWHYAPLAFSFSPTTFSIEGQKVWEESLGKKYRDPTSYHHGIYRHRGFQLSMEEETNANR